MGATVNVNTTPKVVPNDGQPGRFIGADDFVNVSILGQFSP